MSLKLFTPGTAVGLLLGVPAGAAAVVATVALVPGLILAVANDVLTFAVGAVKDLDNHAQSLPRGRANNTRETTTNKCLSALGTCILKFGLLMYRGSIADGDLAVYRRTIRQRLGRCFGFDDAPPNPYQIMAVVCFLQAEVNRLREVSHVLYQRRISQKVRGVRTASRAEREVADDLWERAVLRSRESLQQQL